MTDDLTDEERDIDVLLRSSGNQWRTEHDSRGDPVLMPYSSSTRSHPKTAMQMLAAAVLVAAVIGVTFGVVHGSGTPHAPTAGSSAPLGCQAEAFTAGIGTPAADATGSRATVEVTYSGNAPCLISGMGPEVQLVAPDGTVLLQGRQTVTAAVADETVDPGQQFRFVLLWSSWCGPAFDGGTIRVNLRHSDPNWWITANGQFTGNDVPQCQIGESAIETLPLTGLSH
jgi:hypothetical protein